MNHNPGYEKIGVPTNGPYKGPYTVPTRSLQMSFAGSRPHKITCAKCCVSFPIHAMLMSLRSAPPPSPLQFMQCWCAGLAAGSFGTREVAHMLQLNIAWMGRGALGAGGLDGGCRGCDWLTREKEIHIMTHAIKRYFFIFRPWKGSQCRKIILPIYTSPHFLHGNVYMHASLCLYARIVILV